MNAHRKALERLWKDRCSIFVKEKVTDPTTHLTDFEEKPLLQDQPCKLSFETLTSSTGDPVAAVSQAVKLFISPDVKIPAGCKIVVTRFNDLERSGGIYQPSRNSACSVQGVCLMGKWGRCDFRQMEQLNERLEKLMGADLDRFCRQAAQDLAGRLLNKVVKRTPVVYGTLRDAWAVMPVGHRGTHYTVVVLNNLQYASYVEYGHRQQPGRFIPGYWESDRFVYDPDAEGGMVLKKNWVKGRYMLTISTQELEQQAPKILEKKLYKFLKGCFDA